MPAPSDTLQAHAHGEFARAVERQPVEVHLTVDPSHLRVHWPLCGLLSDYLAGFLLHGRGVDTARAASTAFNEVVENAVKYSAPGASTMDIHAWVDGDQLAIRTRHPCTRAQIDRLLEAVADLDDTSAESRIEAVALLDRQESGLGLLSLANDHGAGIAVSVSRPTGDAMVEVWVELPVRMEAR